MFWDRLEVDINVLHVEQYFIHVRVFELRGLVWEMFAVYVSPSRSIRPAVWEHLGAIKPVFPWVLIGDFNCTISNGE